VISLDTILSSLNDAQREAVTAPGDAVLVLAGAGSGKTRVISARVAWHIEQGVPVEQITAVTFTNKAAREMSARVRGLVEEVPFVGTFHRFGLSVLRRYRRQLGYHTHPNIIDRGDQLGIVRESLKELGLQPASWDVGEALSLILDGRTYKAIEGKVRFPRAHGLVPMGSELVQTYEKRLRALNAVDFDELILVPLRLFHSHPSLFARVQAGARFILVDEFQDTNQAQMELVRKLVGDDGTLMAVGDDDQSIYAFRGARVENILRFGESFPHAQTIRLEDNYRSAKPIIELANAIIRSNPDRNEKTLRVRCTFAGHTQLIGASSEESEADFVAQSIADAIRAGTSPDEIAVLYRANRQAAAIELALTQLAIPFRRVGGTSFFERKEVRDALGWLGILIDGNDDLCFRRAVLAPARGVGEVSLKTLEQAASKQKTSLFRTAESLVDIPGALPNQSISGLKAMISTLKEGRKKLRSAGVSKAFKFVLQQVAYRNYLIQNADTPANGSRRFHRVMQLADTLQSYVNQDPIEGARAFLDDALLMNSDDTLDEDEATVSVMTLHAAKGLEFETVFIVGVEEGILPHERSLGNQSGLSEERRLMYVGVTRAKRNLTLSYVRKRPHGGPVGEDRISRFLRDVGLRPKLVGTLLQDGPTETEQQAMQEIEKLQELLRS